MNQEVAPRTPKENDVIRVAIVDDHPIARYGIESVLGSVPEMSVICSVGSFAELSAQLPEDAPVDVVVLDLYLGTDSPALAEIAQLARTRSVLVISASGRPADVLSAVRAGAKGYVTKGSDRDLIVSTVEAVAAGAFLLSADLADVIKTELTGHPATRPMTENMSFTHLSAREEETLNWVAKGFTHAQTATRMGVRKATVDTYVERIRRKLQVGNKAELTSAALARRRRSQVDEDTDQPG